MTDIERIAAECEIKLAPVFKDIDNTARINTERVLTAFAEHKLAERHFTGTTGYGYNDEGRELCDSVFASVFGCEAGIVRHNIISGTHAIAIGLSGLLRPGDTMLSLTGEPYDTLKPVIGLESSEGSLAEYGVKYRQIELNSEQKPDLPEVKRLLAADKSIRVVYAQRSKGYTARRTLRCEELSELYNTVKSVSDAFVVIDNCYGEFCETAEPSADLLIGSLIKNAGGGVAESGGYLVGSARAIERVSYRLTVPGVGCESGASLGQTRNFFKGIFMAPHTVAQALKTAHFAAALFEALGFCVSPSPLERRSCIIQTLDLGSAERLLAFCKGIQEGSPVDSFVTPVAWDMPGYNDKVVMAAGTFIQGASIELSADAPLRAPFRVYIQGGLTYESGRYGIIKAANRVTE